jgi:hypothetical protein
MVSCARMIPALKEGRLPPGVHRATLQELRVALGWGRKRRQLLDGLERALSIMGSCGVERAYVDGGFVTDKPRPKDIDVCYDAPEDADLAAMFPIYPTNRFTRDITISEFGAEFFPSDMVEGASGQPFLDFFQTDKAGRPRGVILIELGGES